jgi:hypothetical protein
MVDIMCKKGTNCVCAQNSSRFDWSRNVIGASTLTDIASLRNSRAAELQSFKLLVRKDQIARSHWQQNIRRYFIQISQCPGIGKTTLLGQMAHLYQNCLVEDDTAAPMVIGSLVTYNGNVMNGVLAHVSVETALCIRVLYGALACHSTGGASGEPCSNILPFTNIVQSIRRAPLRFCISVAETISILRAWFGQRPIFVGIDEALKCQDGIEDASKKLSALLTASGKFLDVDRHAPTTCVVMSALSPESLLPASIASGRVIENILVLPLDCYAGVQILRSMLLKMDFTVSDDVLLQFEAMTVGHPRALERVGLFLIQPEYYSALGSWKKARGLFTTLALHLARGTNCALATRPAPSLLEYLISNPPVNYRGLHEQLLTRSVDDLLSSGEVLVTKGQTLTIAGWWLYLSVLDVQENEIDRVMCPSTFLLFSAYRATKLVPKHKEPGDGDVPASLYEGFSLFFVAESIRRGGTALQAVAPFLCGAGVCHGFPGNDIIIEKASPLTGKDAESNLSKAMAVMHQINTRKQIGSKCFILVMPASFPAFDAFIMIRGKVVGIQKKSIESKSLTTRINTVRTNLVKWKNAGCDLLGPEGFSIYMVGIDSAPAELTLSGNEVLVTAGELRKHFLDVFFRFGLTGGEGAETFV